MRNVFFAGTAVAIVCLVVNRAIALLNQPSDFAVAAGYFVLLALVSVATGVASWLVRRRRRKP